MVIIVGGEFEGGARQIAYGQVQAREVANETCLAAVEDTETAMRSFAAKVCGNSAIISSIPCIVIMEAG